MSEELEAAGAAVTAGCRAVVDGRSPPPRRAARAVQQLRPALERSVLRRLRAGRAHPSSLLHFGEEVLHNILHFDAKAWRTVLLLVARPGLLTRRYIDGQRTRYVSPLALFLFTMFLMYFVFSLTGGMSVSRRAQRCRSRRGARRAHRRHRRRPSRHRSTRDGSGKRAQPARGRGDAELDLAAARKTLQVVEAALAGLRQDGRRWAVRRRSAAEPLTER